MRTLRVVVLGWLLALVAGAWAQQAPMRFAIFADLHGGERPGVFEVAVQRLNLLQPEFVMCVGDLIAGYEKDPAKLTKQYADFDARAAKFTMPFYRTAGNHDLTYPVALDLYTQRYGTPYYAFTRGGAQFLVLNSEDPPGTESGALGAEQLAYFKAAIERDAKPRWTFVFLHKPIWKYQPAEWAKFEALLGDRPYTVFAGHEHEYVQTVRNGREYYILATTGGANDLKGPLYGHMDHLMWVTLTEQGPSVAVLLLDGVSPGNLRDEKTAALLRALRDPHAVTVKPITVQGTFRGGRTLLQFGNTATLPVRIQGSFTTTGPVRVAPATFDVTIPPQDTSAMHLTLTAAKAFTLKPAEAMGIPFTYTASATLPDGRTIALDPVTAYIGLIKSATCPRGTAKVDGKLDEWKMLPYALEKPAEIYTPAQEGWQGAADASARFGVRADADHLYIAVQVTDDAIVAKPEVAPWGQDGLEIRFDARPDPARSLGRGQGEGKEFLLIPLSPGATAAETINIMAKDLPAGVRAVCVLAPGGYTAEIAIPMSYLRDRQPAAPRAFRLNLALNDRDGGSQTWMSWHGDWRRAKNIPGAGTFVLAE